MKLLLIGLLLSYGAFAADYKFVGQDYGPYNYMDNGKSTGAMDEIMDAICAVNKDKCTLEIWPLKRALSALEAGEIHAVVAVLKNTDRDGYANFLPGLIKSDMIYVTSTDKPNITSVKELNGWTVGGVSGATSLKIATQDVATAGNGAKVVEDANSETTIKKVSNGRYGEKGAIVINEDVLHFLDKKMGVTNLKKLFVAKSDEFGIYFSKKSVDQATFNKFVAAVEHIKKNGELKKILTKYNLKN